MKVLIAYYSRGGQTEKVAEVIKKELGKRGHSVDIEKVKPLKEHGWWGWFFIRIFQGECEIEAPKLRDVSKYDAILIGSPNWTRVSLPVARYLREVTGLKYKNIGLFATTALWPPFEWYVFSAFLLDLTFSRIIGKKGGRIITSILLSSLFKRWSLASEYGKRAIKDFCDKITTPIISFRDYILNQKEIEGTRLLIVIFSTLLFFSLIFQITSSALGLQFFTWDQYLPLFIIGFLSSCIMTLTMERKRGVFLGKYIAGASLVFEWTLVVLFLQLSLGRSILLGYILILIFVSFFRDIKVVLFTGLVTLFGYSYLLFYYPRPEIIKLGLDFPLILLTLGVVGFITRNLQGYFSDLLELQDEMERERVTLEIKVKARTKELEELTQALEEKVKGRTMELRQRIEELEKFNKLVVGRELKMIELKEEIAKLKKELENKGRK